MTSLRSNKRVRPWQAILIIAGLSLFGAFFACQITGVVHALSGRDRVEAFVTHIGSGRGGYNVSFILAGSGADRKYTNHVFLNTSKVEVSSRLVASRSCDMSAAVLQPLVNEMLVEDILSCLFFFGLAGFSLVRWITIIRQVPTNRT
jgi:hypothetical protein